MDAIAAIRVIRSALRYNFDLASCNYDIYAIKITQFYGFCLHHITGHSQKASLQLKGRQLCGVPMFRNILGAQGATMTSVAITFDNSTREKFI